MSIGWYRPKPLKSGEKAPDFSLESTSGQLCLSDSVKDGPIVIAFYMGDFGTTCSWVLSKFRDIWNEFETRGIRLWAISHDGISMHRRYNARMDFPYPLLSDADEKVMSDYGCRIENHDIYTGMAGRAVYVVDEDGIIVYAWAAMDDPAQAPDYAGLLEFIRSFRSPR